MTYHSQHGEDRWLIEHVPMPKHGVFVEMGADDGIELSNTYHFEQRGWTGLLIEPNPGPQEALRRNRPNSIVMQCAVGDPNQPKAFFVHPTAGWSGFNRGGRIVEVPLRCLDDVLTEAGIAHIDLLSLDTEGSELEIWGTFDYRQWSPRIVIVEFYTSGLPQPDNSAAVRETFAACGYQEIHATPGNLIFRSSIP